MRGKEWSPDLRILITYYSRSGHTEKVATRIAENMTGHEVSVRKVIPVKERGYTSWLALSFFPGSRVPIQSLDVDVSDFDLVMLGCPKWTLSCPPFNSVIAGMKTQMAKKAVFFMTFGGFDEERYSAAIVSKLRRRGFEVLPVLMVETKKVESGEYISLVDDFCRDLFKTMGTGNPPSHSKSVQDAAS